MPEGPRRRPRLQGGPASDIERFLQEVERLRKKPPPRPSDDVVDEVEVVQPARPAAPPPRVEQPRSPQRIAAEPVAEVIPVRPAAPIPAAPKSEFATPSAGGMLLSNAAPRKMTRGGRVVSPLILQVVDMLGRREQTRAAILLSEILSPPMSRRRR